MKELVLQHLYAVVVVIVLVVVGGSSYNTQAANLFLHTSNKLLIIVKALSYFSYASYYL